MFPLAPIEFDSQHLTLKFTGVGTIKLVQFPDSSLNGGFPGVVEAIGESAKSLGEIR